jgi:hypothetical protein
MVDLTGIDGLNEEQTAKLSALFDNEIGGLKNKVDQLLGEKKTVQQGLTEKEQALEEARKAAVTAEETRLIESGNYKEALAVREKEVAEAIAKANESAETANKALLERDRGDTLGQVMDLIHDDHKWVSKAMLSNMLEIGYNDQQQQVVSFKHDGNVVANNVDEFKSWANEQDSFKRILKGVDSSGAGTTQSQGSGAAVGDTLESCKGDKKLEAEYFNKQLQQG